MKRIHRDAYLASMVEFAQQKTTGQTLPIVFLAYSLLSRACDAKGIAYSYTKAKSADIVRVFGDELHGLLLVEGIYVLKATKAIVAHVGNDTVAVIDPDKGAIDEGGNAAIDENRTAVNYDSWAKAHSTNPYVGFALFGKDAPRSHPMFPGTYGTRHRSLKTQVANHNRKVIEGAPNLMLPEYSEDVDG